MYIEFPDPQSGFKAQWVVDGAHTPEAAKYLAETLKLWYPNKKFVFCIAMANDKNARGIASNLYHNLENRRQESLIEGVVLSEVCN